MLPGGILRLIFVVRGEYKWVKNLLKELSVKTLFRLALGMCPALAITTSVDNAVGMGIALLVYFWLLIL